MTTRLEQVIGPDASGVRRFTSRRSSRDLCRSIERAGRRCFIVDLRDATDKGEIIERWLTALDAPAWAGRNWDALFDLLTDLAWSPASGYVLFVSTGRQVAPDEPEAWRPLARILTDAAAHWRREGTPFLVLVRGPRAARLVAGDQS